MKNPDTARIGRTVRESTPAFSVQRQPPEGAPNVVMIVLDDLGFAQLGCFGSDVATPAIDGLAAGGLRYNRFHVTSLCSPTRACLLTGRNPHAVGMGFLTDVPIGFPGYNGRIPRSAAALPRVLRDEGYSTFALGKWHLIPRWEQSASGPFDQWPLGLGFEQHYGFLAGDTNQFAPELVRDNHFVDPPRTPAEGYHLTEDLAGEAIQRILDHRHTAPHRPFFLYFATGAMHAPHQAPPEWIERQRGKFDNGWESWRRRAFERQVELGIVPAGTMLTERPSWVDAWDDVPADHRRLFARQMEVFAGFLEHTDHQIGRVLACLADQGILDDTIVMVLSDNGTSAEGGPVGTFNEHRFTHDIYDDPDETLARIDELGGPRSYNHYAWGWAWAGNTPLRLWKRYTWLGGVRTPLIVHWPNGIDARGEIRVQFCHAIDLMPTILDAAGIEQPRVVDGIDQQRVDGASLLTTFADADAPSPRTTQYFEMVGSRAIYHDGWKATTDHVGQQLEVEVRLLEGSLDFDDDHWALFDLRNDFSESDDVSEQHPDVARRLVELWWAEAGANQVMPLDDSFIGRAVALEPPPFRRGYRTTFTPGGGAVAEDLLPPMGGGFRLLADVDVPDTGAEGIVCALGDWSNGWALYLLEGRLVAVFNLFGTADHFDSGTAVPGGRHVLGIEYRREPKDRLVTVTVDDEPVAEGRLARDLPFRWQIGGTGMRIGVDRGFPVCDDYEPPFPFTGTVHSVTIELPSLAPPESDEATRQIAHAMRHE